MMISKCVTFYLILLGVAVTGTASDHPVFDRQKERDRRLSRYSLELEQYGVIQKNFSIERMKEIFAQSKFSRSNGPPLQNNEPLPASDADGYSDASFRFLIHLDVMDALTHFHRRTLQQDHLPFAFPGLPPEIRITNAKGFEEGLSQDTSTRYDGYTVAPDQGVINFRRSILEWCCGFGLTRYVIHEEQIHEVNLGSGLTECTGTLNLPWLGGVSFRAEIDEQDILRCVVIQKERSLGDVVFHTISNSGQYSVENDSVATSGSFIREIPFHPVDSQKFRPTEIDDGFTTKLVSLTRTLSAGEFVARSSIQEIPQNARVIDATYGKAKIPTRAGTGTPVHSKFRFWMFTLNLAAVFGFIFHQWRKRTRPRLNAFTEK